MPCGGASSHPISMAATTSSAPPHTPPATARAACGWRWLWEASVVVPRRFSVHLRIHLVPSDCDDEVAICRYPAIGLKQSGPAATWKVAASGAHGFGSQHQFLPSTRSILHRIGVERAVFRLESTT